MNDKSSPHGLSFNQVGIFHVVPDWHYVLVKDGKNHTVDIC